MADTAATDRRATTRLTAGTQATKETSYDTSYTYCLGGPEVSVLDRGRSVRGSNPAPASPF